MPSTSKLRVISIVQKELCRRGKYKQRTDLPRTKPTRTRERKKKGSRRPARGTFYCMRERATFSTRSYRDMQRRHIDCYMTISNWYMRDVIRIHLLPRLAEDSKRSEIGHLRGQKTCTTTRRRVVPQVIINDFLAVTEKCIIDCVRTRETLKPPKFEDKKISVPSSLNTNFSA